MTRAKGYGATGGYNAPLGTDTFVFADDGLIPNSRLPLIVRRGAITPDKSDPAKAFERTFAANGWTGAWRDGIYDYCHYHSTAHEVLGIASGSATVRFGGADGETLGLTAGDVAVVPAGVGHALITESGDLLVVGGRAGAIGTSSATTRAPSRRHGYALRKSRFRASTRSTVRTGR